MLLKQLEGSQVHLPIDILFLETGAVRVSIDEENRQKENIVLRHGSHAQKRRYDEAEKWALSGKLKPDSQSILVTPPAPGITRVLYGNDRRLSALIHPGCPVNKQFHEHCLFGP